MIKVAEEFYRNWYKIVDILNKDSNEETMNLEVPWINTSEIKK